jgi:hypothetical protein
MRCVLLLFACIAVGNATPAPEAIAGAVFRESGGIPGLRMLWERTVIFGPDGRYTYVKNASASTIDGNWSIQAPPPDGTFVYAKTGELTGTITFSDPAVAQLYAASSDASVTLTLQFSGDAAPEGILARGEYFRGGRLGVFSLTRVATIQRQALANVSMRGVASNDRPLIVGFVIQGDFKDVVVRVVGPTLRSFGVSESWANPRFEIYQGGATTPIGGPPGPRRNAIAYYDDWSADTSAVSGLQRLFAHVGAFALEPGSRDAVGVTPRMAPGAYTIVSTPGSSDAGGEALIEVYALP